MVDTEHEAARKMHSGPRRRSHRTRSRRRFRPPSAQQDQKNVTLVLVVTNELLKRVVEISREQAPTKEAGTLLMASRERGSSSLTLKASPRLLPTKHHGSPGTRTAVSDGRS
jgi:hypothetical protein